MIIILSPISNVSTGNSDDEIVTIPIKWDFPFIPRVGEYIELLNVPDIPESLKEYHCRVESITYTRPDNEWVVYLHTRWI